MCLYALCPRPFHIYLYLGLCQSRLSPNPPSQKRTNALSYLGAPLSYLVGSDQEPFLSPALKISSEHLIQLHNTAAS